MILNSIIEVIYIIGFNILRKKITMTPTQIIVIGFASMILIGTLLLNMPLASKNGQPVGLINAIFTATSAVCVTGMAVVDTGRHWTVFGQVVIILLVQIGGLGIMTMSTSLALLTGRRITLKERILIQESLNQSDLEGLVRLTKNIIITTLTIEFIGAVIYSLIFISEYGAVKGIAFGVFHAISTFCNAGVEIIGEYRGFAPYINNFVFNINAMVLIIIGGLGFSVWQDIYQIYKGKSFKSISLHSKIVLTSTAVLILSGALFIFILEFGNPDTLKNLPFPSKVVTAFFHSVSPRTAGINTLDMTALTVPTKLLTMILMFIGGSPGSVSGGIKTATAAILVITVVAAVKGKEDPEIFERHIPKYLVYRAMAVAVISLCIVIIVAMILSITETADFMTLLFEATAAFSTAGLTLNYTPNLSSIGKVILCITMFVGRVGPLTIVIAFAKRATGNKGNLKYPEEKILVG